VVLASVAFRLPADMNPLLTIADGVVVSATDVSFQWGDTLVTTEQTAAIFAAGARSILRFPP
jgi:hypothetical protein